MRRRPHRTPSSLGTGAEVVGGALHFSSCTWTSEDDGDLTYEERGRVRMCVLSYCIRVEIVQGGDRGFVAGLMSGP